MKVGDTPGFEYKETCPHCGKIAEFRWNYGENDGKSKGYEERLCCKDG